MSLKGILILLIFLLSIPLLAQENHEEVKKNKVGAMLAHATIPSGFEGTNTILIVPLWGFSYDRFITENFAVGARLDFFLQQFKVEEKDSALLRANPIALALVGEYKFYKGLAVVAGGGFEYERHKNLGFATFGLEYGFEFANNWEVGLNFIYDIKFEGYQNFIFGVSGIKQF